MALLLGVPHSLRAGKRLMVQPGSCFRESPLWANANTEDEYNTASRDLAAIVAFSIPVRKKRSLMCYSECSIQISC